MKPAVVVGAGLGGLAAAISLASRGISVVVLEAADGPGGKAGQRTVDGVSFDTGPSVLTLPTILADLLAQAGRSVDEVVTLRRPEPAFRYRWPDGTELDVCQNPSDTEARVRETLGAEAASDFAAFMAYSRAIWESAAPYFVLARAPSVTSMMSLGPGAMKAAARIDPFRSMWAAITAQVRSPHLRDLFARFATYNGSDPRKAPATLNCIAHVEMGLGSFGIEGGVHQLPAALAGVAADCGAELRYGAPVERIEVGRAGVTGVRLRGGEHIGAERVVINADVSHLVDDLLPRGTRVGFKPAPPTSTSGWTAVVKAPRRSDAVAHLALFPERYLEEFDDLFERDRPPQEPTVYLCNQAVAHGRPGWEDRDPVFIMANAPSQDPRKPTSDTTWERLSERVRARLVGAGLWETGQEVVWQRTPRGLADRFPGSRGALYGAASNGMWSAFQRPPNKVRKPRGLYLASGSAHPGGGMPLCLMSGRLAADALREDLGERP